MAALFMIMGAFMAFGKAGFVIMAGIVAWYYDVPQLLAQARRDRRARKP